MTDKLMPYQDYSVTASSALVSICTGLTGAQYARRHWQLSNIYHEHCLGHRVIAILEAIPVLGALAALIERIVAYINFHKDIVLEAPSCSSWTPRQLPIAKAEEKMRKNARKAIEEHQVNAGNDYTAYASVNEVFAEPFRREFGPLLTFTHNASAAQGPRETMEDCHFCATLPNGNLLAGVFDGHGGAEVAQIANQLCQENFSVFLTNAKGNVHEAMEALIDAIQRDDRVQRSDAGTTVVLSYIDKLSSKIYTATLGDAEANIYRRFGDRLKSIPLSCIRVWNHIKEALRAAILLDNSTLARVWPTRNAKDLRLSLGGSSINVSRAIGDKNCRGYKDGDGTISKPGVIHKPKITMQMVKPGDVVILTCDGGKDFVKESEIVAQVQAEKDFSALSQRLVDYSISKMSPRLGGDNCTVVAISVS